ncbi:asparagine synthetase B family protein [Streptomyces sp. NBC_01435]|uniref:asparagine synthetase B family protein n=1 Tax=Streptomyces sp. NBC_01435 TaxID=2903865 RepID=UPI002E2F4318|nr:asparagine synthetase B [Streptomyces sp. NBC_01435]
MCGIFGGVGVSEQEARAALENINRGNDGITVSTYGGVVLGSRRHLVKISDKEGVDEGQSDQPYDSDVRPVSLVFNGEFFNFAEFKAGCLRDALFKTQGDTEVFLKLYEAEGIDFLKRRDIDSMFALGILDREQNKLYITRDWPGRVPLFYYYDKDSRTFLFSSQLSGLHTLDRVDLNNAHELVPGHYLTLDLDTFELEETCYYKVQAIKKDQELLDIGQELHQRLQKSARNRTMGDVPICTMLSGGIDSLMTTHYVLASIDFKNVSYQPTSYVFAVEGFDSPDVQRARIAAEGFKEIGLVHKEVFATAEQLVEDIPDIVRLFEMRNIKALSVYPLPIYYYLAPVMKADGFKVTIGGHGVDELLGAYDNWKELNTPHKVQSGYAARLLFINNIWENMMRRASIIFMERGPIEARFPFLQQEVCEYLLGVDPKWLQITPHNVELMLELISKRGGPQSDWGRQLPWIHDYLVQYLDAGGKQPGGFDESQHTDVEKLFWKFPLMVAGMHAAADSYLPFNLLFNAKLRGQHGAGISSLEPQIIKRYADLGNTDIEIYRSMVTKAFRLRGDWFEKPAKSAV